MSESAETVVRNYLAAFLQKDLDELVSFFSDDAVFTDGPRGVHHGIDAIRAELGANLKIVPSASIDIKKLVASGGTVMVERVDSFKLGGKPFDLEVAGVFDVDDNGRIKRWRDYYDLKSLEDRFTSAGIALPR
jgi:limonene-1,2-epoxide hydrolase